MTHRSIRCAAAVLTAIVFPSVASAQSTRSPAPRPAPAAARPAAAKASTDDMVQVGDKFIGGRLSLAGTSGISIPIGAVGEYIFKDGFEEVKGAWGIAVSADFYSYSFGPFRQTYIPISGQARYHFKISSAPKFVPFASAGLGFVVASGDAFTGALGTGLYLVAGGGARYFLSEKFALEGTVGAQNAGALTIGATLKF